MASRLNDLDGKMVSLDGKISDQNGTISGLATVIKHLPEQMRTVLREEKEGSEGAASHFEGRFVVKGKSEVQSFAMNSVSEGSFSLTLENTLEEAYIIIASVPEQFTSAQNYGYSITISQ